MDGSRVLAEEPSIKHSNREGLHHDGLQATSFLPHQVRNTVGDEPRNAVIADGHAGLVWNVLWAQSLVAHLLNLGTSFDYPESRPLPKSASQASATEAKK